jgi:hypothetical protein
VRAIYYRANGARLDANLARGKTRVLEARPHDRAKNKPLEARAWFAPGREGFARIAPKSADCRENKRGMRSVYRGIMQTMTALIAAAAADFRAALDELDAVDERLARDGRYGYADEFDEAMDRVNMARARLRELAPKSALARW